MTIRTAILIAALLGLAACEDVRDLTGLGAQDSIQYSNSPDTLGL